MQLISMWHLAEIEVRPSLLPQAQMQAVTSNLSQLHQYSSTVSAINSSWRFSCTCIAGEVVKSSYRSSCCNFKFVMVALSITRAHFASLPFWWLDVYKKESIGRPTCHLENLENLQLCSTKTMGNCTTSFDSTRMHNLVANLMHSDYTIRR